MSETKLFYGIDLYFFPPVRRDHERDWVMKGYYLTRTNVVPTPRVY